MHSFLSFAALGMIPPPSRWEPDCQFFRCPLSLSGVVVADMVSCSEPVFLPGHMFTGRPNKRSGMIRWTQIEARSYMFGAIRNEPDQFTDAFLNELRARPDLFCVATRSETDPDRKIHIFGGLESATLPQVRTRRLEAPPGMLPVGGRGEWHQERTLFDILYGTKGPKPGYLVTSKEPGSFFYSKRFPVKYFVIMDAVPGRSITYLARDVAWAALRAQGLAKGNCNFWKFARAADQLKQKHTEERLTWMPKSALPKTGSMKMIAFKYYLRIYAPYFALALFAVVTFVAYKFLTYK
ncbi:hypothetical protein VKT23_007923 [Stygiomarasmius scandens]|uniref:Uncharacterized protein n=1 Tax=Marasmiellus scandens TaxID=2682957 RepID=A0ABR1JM27_9AGAR